MPWKLWKVSLFGFLILFANFCVANAVFLLGLLWNFSVRGLPWSRFFESFPSLVQAQMERAGLVSWSIILGALSSLGILLFLLFWARGVSPASYLAFRNTTRKQFGMWFAIYALFLAASTILGYYLDRPQTPEFMQILVCDSSARFLLFIAVALAAPLFEELFFRGFLFQGFWDSKLGLAGALLIPNLIWSAIHLQYDIYDISQVFAMGLLLGLARHFGRSIFLPLFLHVFHNTIAFAWTWFLRDCG